MKGYIQVYTGDGKGKTTAALGLTLRAVGAGLKVFIAQFIKMGDYSEIGALERMSESVAVEQFGCGRFPKGRASEEDIALARRGLERVKEVFASHQHDVVIMDEVNVAVSLRLFDVEALLQIMDSKPPDVELIVTGRNAPTAVIEKADLVSEVKAVKHYFQNGVKARIGIEK